MDVRTRLRPLSVSIFASAVLAWPAFAQAPATPSPGTKQVIPEKQGEPLQDGRSESLSKKLSRTDGVIKPSGNVDPGMKSHKPDPGTSHTMPVIPPSATPGGNTAK